jgi:hypothetical protein
MFATTTFEPTDAMIHGTFEVFNASVAGVKSISGLTWSLSMEMVPEGQYQRKADSNSLGMTNRKGTRAVVLLTAGWQREEDDAHVYAAAAALVSAIEEKARSLDAYDPYLYLNYAAPWQSPIASYGVDKVESLRALRARVDPTAFFTKRVRGGFKIPDDDGSYCGSNRTDGN